MSSQTSRTVTVEENFSHEMDKHVEQQNAQLRKKGREVSIGPDERAYSLKDPSSDVDSVKECGCEDVVLLVAAAALLVIGILASAGLFDAMGRANAQYFSYGMYGGAGVLMVALVIKMVVCYRKQMDFAGLKQKGAEFAANYQFKEEYPLSGGGSVKLRIDWAQKRVRSTILAIIDNPEFQSDPVKYLRTYKKSLTAKEIVDGIVVEFFEQHYKITKIK